MAPAVTPRRPSNGLLVFSGESLTLGLVMALMPAWVRTGGAFHFLCDFNIVALGWGVCALAAAQVGADAMGMLCLRSVPSALLTVVHVTMAAGIALDWPSISAVEFLFFGIVHGLLAARAI